MRAIVTLVRDAGARALSSAVLFDDVHRLHSADFFGVWRAGDVVGVRIEGELTDARNPVWRAWLDARFAADGWPRFIALDVKDAIPMASLPMRIKTALWGRATLARIDHGVIALGRDARVGLTVRAILRVAGMNNVTLLDDASAFAKAVDALSAPASAPSR